MNKLEIRGVIVPSNYDDEFFADYIARGIITPESRVRTALGTADKTKALQLHINSPGGSVFAGNEMINAINAWTKESGQPIEITIGAMAASMAAAMVINVNAAKIVAHKNTKIMFHGAMTDTIGGKQAHEDAAVLLEKINNDLKVTLVTRFKFSPEQVNEWFAEGRAGWLSAEEAKAAGMVSEIIDQMDKPKKMNKTAMTMLFDRGLKLAAILEPEMIEEEPTIPEVTPNASGEKPNETLSIPAEAVSIAKVGDTGTAITGAGEETTPTLETPVIPESVDVAKLSEKAIALQNEINSINAAFNAERVKLVKDARDWQAKYDKAVNDFVAKEITAKAAVEIEKQALNKTISEKDSRITGLESRLSKLTLQALELHPDAAVADWPGAMKACNGDYEAAAKKYPEILAETIKTANKGKR